MELSKIASGVIVLVVAVVLAGVLVIPVIQDVTATEQTFTNTGYYNMGELDSDSDYKLYWDHNYPKQVTINDDTIISYDGQINDYQAITLVGTDEFVLRFLNDPSNNRVQIYGNATWGFTAASVSAGTDFTLSITGGTLSMSTNAETPYSASGPVPSKTWGIMPNGEYVMKKANVSAYVLSSSSIITLSGVSNNADYTLEASIFADGTVSDGLDYVLYRPSSQADTVIFSNEQFTASQVGGYNDLIRLDKVEFDITLTGGTIEPTYTYFIVPSSVTAELSNHLDSTEIALFSVVSVLILVVIVMMAVRMISGRAD